MNKVGVVGGSGRMGQRIQRVLSTVEPQIEVHCFDQGDAIDFIGLDAVIDFSLPTATKAVVDGLRGTSAVLVSGVTGRSEAELALLRSLSKTNAVLTAANFSWGIHVMSHLVKQAAHMLDAQFQIEISETHHQHKQDLPSGTALFLGSAAAKGRGDDWREVYVDRQSGKSRKHSNEIGVSALRGGSVIGAHSVHFFGANEEIELAHTATDRDVFATGAVRAANWLTGQGPGAYTMNDFVTAKLGL
jgi:4-hydroxy-tetrahydrodipicolinate reductase